jgi:deazaflavin-dependent oxidoreductase (nitroreductase family)
MPLPQWLARSNKNVANRVIGPVARYLPLFAVVHHVGRVSGREYAVPVNIFRDGEEYVIALTYSSDVDWVKNVLAVGWCEVETRGRRIRLESAWVEVDREKRWAPGIVRFFLNRLGVHETLRLTASNG